VENLRSTKHSLGITGLADNIFFTDRFLVFHLAVHVIH